MKFRHYVPFVFFALVISVSSYAQSTNAPKDVIEWKIAELPCVDSVMGHPTIVETVLGKAVRFDGVGDAFFLKENPLIGNKEMTIEFIFKPEGNAPFAQRFLHAGELKGPRVMFETRVTPENMWYFDAHTAIEGGKSRTLIDEKLLHPTDKWYNVTLIVYKNMVVTYVNGSPQLWGALDFEPFSRGITSIGVRQNKVNWFKGVMYKIKVTPQAILPRDFLNDYKVLNDSESVK